jgi:two-component system NarL family sensor kinase
MAAAIMEKHDEQQRRMAHQLHDTTGQNLSALSINLSVILASAGIDANAREALKESIALADSCVREIRTISYLLHPPLLDELGLVSALRAHYCCFSKRTGIQLDLDLPSHMPRLPEATEISLFRIIEEGLANIHRHSGSPTAILRLKHQPDRIEVKLADRGCGISPAAMIGTGMTAMIERARKLGGRLTIATGPTGTTLTVVLPLLPQQLDTTVRRP